MFVISNEELARMDAMRKQMGEDRLHELNLAAMEAADFGFRRELDGHMRLGADPNAKDSSGNPILFHAHQPGCALTLLKWRADPTIAGVKGTLPLLHHINKGNVTVAQIISSRMPPAVLNDMRAAALEAGSRLSGGRFWETKVWVKQAFSVLNV